MEKAAALQAAVGNQATARILHSTSGCLGKPGRGLGAATQSEMESRFGCSLGHVRIHSDDEAHQSAARIGAKAFAFGSHRASDDPLEREADAIAEAVVQRKEQCLCVGDCPDCSQREQASFQGKPRQGDRASDVGASPNMTSRLGTGRPLDETAQRFFGSRLSHDFSRARIHTDARAQESALAVSARAFTYGKHIVFASGQYAPGTIQGQRLLAHELTHVVQQAHRRLPSIQRDTLGQAGLPEVFRTPDWFLRLPKYMRNWLLENPPAMDPTRTESMRGMLRAYRRHPRVPPRIDPTTSRGRVKGGTVALAQTDIPPLVSKDFPGASSAALPEQLRGTPGTIGGRVLIPANPTAQRHAEHVALENVRREIDRMLGTGTLDRSELRGRTVFVLVEQEPCPSCASGSGRGRSGVIAQFSERYPELTVEVRNMRTSRAYIYQSGQLLNPSGADMPLRASAPSVRPGGSPASGTVAAKGGKGIRTSGLKGLKGGVAKSFKGIGRGFKAFGRGVRAVGRGLWKALPVLGPVLEGIGAISTFYAAKAQVEELERRMEEMWAQYEQIMSELDAVWGGASLNTEDRPAVTPAGPTPSEPDLPARPDVTRTVSLYAISGGRLTEAQVQIPEAALGVFYHYLPFASLTPVDQSIYDVDASEFDCRKAVGLAGIGQIYRFEGYVERGEYRRLKGLLKTQLDLLRLSCLLKGLSEGTLGPEEESLRPDGDYITIRLHWIEGSVSETITATCEGPGADGPWTHSADGDFENLKRVTEDGEAETRPDYILEVDYVRISGGSMTNWSFTLTSVIENPEHEAPEPRVTSEGELPPGACDARKYPADSVLAYVLTNYAYVYHVYECR